MIVNHEKGLSEYVFRPFLIGGWFYLNVFAFLCDFDYVAVAVDDFFVVLSYVREHTAAAVLKTVFGIFKVASAVFAERIERTVAEKTIKILRVIGLMTGEEFTILM